MGQTSEMDLRAYRKKQGWSYADLARFLNVANSSVVRKHEKGMAIPTPELIERYTKLTKGEVTYSDFVASRNRFRRAQAQSQPREPAPA